MRGAVIVAAAARSSCVDSSPALSGGSSGGVVCATTAAAVGADQSASSFRDNMGRIGTACTANMFSIWPGIWWWWWCCRCRCGSIRSVGPEANRAGQSSSAAAVRVAVGSAHRLHSTLSTPSATRRAPLHSRALSSRRVKCAALRDVARPTCSGLPVVKPTSVRRGARHTPEKATDREEGRKEEKGQMERHDGISQSTKAVL